MTEQTVRSSRAKTEAAGLGRAGTAATVSLSPLHRGVLMAIAASEALLLVAAARGWVNASLLMLAHVGLVSGMAVMLGRQISSGADGGLALLATLATLATGPIGAIGALMMPHLVRRNPITEARLNAWYQRIALSGDQDAFTKLSDRIAIGRAANLSAPAPQAFADLFRSGPLAEQQTALGLIARAFHPGYLPVLKIALDSTQPLIRVQAAAVAARIRGQLNSQVATLCVRAADPATSTSAAADIVNDLGWAIGSGLLEEGVRLDASRVRDALQARSFARFDALERLATALKTERPSTAASEAYAAMLLAHGRFADFRARRLRFRRPLHGRYRHRWVRARPVGTGLALRALRVRQ